MKNIKANSSFANYNVSINAAIADGDIDKVLAMGIVYDWQRRANSAMEKLFWPAGATKRPEGFKRYTIAYTPEGAAAIKAKAAELGFAVGVSEYIPASPEASRKGAQKHLAFMREFSVLEAFLAKHHRTETDFTTDEELVEFIHQHFGK